MELDSNNHPSFHFIMKRYFIVPILLIATACGVTDSKKSNPNVQVTMSGSPSTAGKIQSTSTDLLVITMIKLHLDELELESVEDSLDIEVNNTIISLPLGGAPIVLAEQGVVPGLYASFELEVERPDDSGPRPADTDFWDQTGRYSVVVIGTFNGEPFKFRSAQDFELEMEFEPALLLGDDTESKIHISVDYMSWFRQNGVYVDPRIAGNRKAIEERIELSFDVASGDIDDDN